MFDVLVYLYGTYYRPDACPVQEALVKKLCAVGFEEEEISEAIGWLAELAEANHEFSDNYPQQSTFSFGTRIYVGYELDQLGAEAIGFIQFLESAKLINPIQREIIIERALATNESPMPIDKLKVTVLIVLWSQGKEPDNLMFDELFFDDGDEPEPKMLH